MSGPGQAAGEVPPGVLNPPGMDSSGMYPHASSSTVCLHKVVHFLQERVGCIDPEAAVVAL